MKFMVHDPAVGPESLTVEEGDTPQYDHDKEVLIKIEATAANRADLLQVSQIIRVLVKLRFLFIVARQVPATQRSHQCDWSGMRRVSC